MRGATPEITGSLLAHGGCGGYHPGLDAMLRQDLEESGDIPARVGVFSSLALQQSDTCAQEAEPLDPKDYGISE
ncbi:hypothetical protein CMO91_00320 [Candidatus Woesearchaeota archaeon]|nr:hypothetical protein [Candidatus Woesearchaeota archaeon]